MNYWRFLSLLLLEICHLAYSSPIVESVGAYKNDIEKKALSLVQQTQHTQPGEELRVIPGLASFNCPGTISSIFFIADSNASPDSSITFSFWNPSSTSDQLLLATQGDSYNVTRRNVQLISSSGNFSLYLAVLSPPLEFKAGEVLGIEQRPDGLALQYVYGQGPENFIFSESLTKSGVFAFAAGPVAVRDHPLLDMNYNCETCRSTCVNSRFYSYSSLGNFLEVNTNPIVIAPFLGSPHISPLLRFTNTGTITRWSFSGILGSDQPPELAIWRANGTSEDVVYQIVTDASSTDITKENVTDKTFVTQNIAFRAGDVLGVSFCGEQRVVLGEILLSPDNYAASGYDPGDADTDYESGVIEISLAVDLDVSDDEATEPDQLVAEPVITTETLFSDTHSELEYTALPQFSISVYGHLTHWQFAAQFVPALRPDRQSLQVQVWREAPNVLMRTFRLVHSINVSVHQGAVSGGSPGIWEVTLDEPLAVEPGDILGFHQPPTQLRLALLNDSMTPVHDLSLLHAKPFVLTRSTTDNNAEMATPLMLAEVFQGPKPSPTPTNTPTVAATTEDEPLLSRDETIITAAVSGAVVLVGAVLVGLMLLYCCRKICCTGDHRLQHKSSLYYTAKPQSDNSLSSRVYLRSHISTPEPDNVMIGYNEPATTTMTFY